MQSVLEISWEALTNRTFTPSPETWTDQVLYLLVLDRFSNNQESAPLIPADKNSVLTSEESASTWRTAGDHFCGGTLRGVQSKLEYLKKLGITTIWLTPIYKQPPWDTRMYHGYGVQDFLTIDPRFGTPEDLVALVTAAHERGMYVILDIILNHTGNVFGYDWPVESETEPPFSRSGYDLLGFRDQHGQPTIATSQLETSGADEVVWPRELQTPEAFHRRGCITQWEEREQYLTGDFKFLKDLNLGSESESGFEPSLALRTLIEVHKYWLAVADLDGFRLDAVKHMPTPASTLFVQELQAFARSIGKENFAIFGEIPDGQAVAHQMVEATGLSASLAILDLPVWVEQICLGKADPESYFRYFTESIAPQPNPQAWKSTAIVTQYDDHDQIRKGYDKARFAAITTHPSQQLLPIFLLATTCGIPALYYGSEQGFDGAGSDDNYIRECMFGGAFGAFRSRGKHCFDEFHPVYQETSRLLQVRAETPALRRGNQRLLEISGDGEHFGFPRAINGKLESIIAWTRSYQNQTVLCAFNTSPTQTLNVYLPINAASAKSLYESNQHAAELTLRNDTTATLKLEPNQCYCALI